MTSKGITVTDGKTDPINVAEDHPNFKQVLDYIKLHTADMDGVLKLVDLKQELKYSDDSISVTVEGDDKITVLINGKEKETVDPSLIKRIINTLRSTTDLATFNMQMFGKFLSRLYKNPSYKVVTQLYNFLAKNDLPLTNDGTFYAYKKVDYDYYDLYSHTIKNEIGTTIEVDRNDVEDDPVKTCSKGLHVCSKSYLKSFGARETTVNRILIVEVDPENVVSVPYDYNNAKMRVCKYKVIDEITDFSQSLSPYYMGKHKSGWIKETLDKIYEIYINFWKFKDKEMFDWEYLENRGIYLTTGIKYKFEKVLYENFPNASEGLKKQLKEECAGTIALHPLKLFNILAKYDEQAAVSPDDESEKVEEQPKVENREIPF